MHDLSIVIPTCNRGELLDRCLTSIQDTTRCSFEIIVVDGASTDQTAQVLARAAGSLGSRLKIIREPVRQGFVRAANLGFRAAAGRMITWLNDDARPLPGALDRAVAQIDAGPDDLGLVALFHRWHSVRNIAYETFSGNQVYRLCHVRGTLYANFGLGRRQTFERLGYFDERYFFFAADPDFSLKVWHAGMRIEPAYGSIIDHDEHVDRRRHDDGDTGSQDNRKLMAKWLLPPKNALSNDFNPFAPCTLGGLRDTPAAIAA